MLIQIPNLNIVLKPIVTKEYLQLEPIGLVFVGFFALILIIQFFAMLFHRFGTLSHILAATEVTCSKQIEAVTKESAVEKEGVRLIREFQKLKNFDGTILQINMLFSPFQESLLISLMLYGMK